ncbi:MAG: Uncharacterized protein G01um101493_316 [Microgenomates group bacterium Gr01-1014_93]|nr:MAG: Uncharacterized protein G01um101493_316 [Microgenomates group bacterium Gr01-1014_93]
MDFLQIALIFLIGLLTVFLTVTGIQVFFILRDLRKMLLGFKDELQGIDPPSDEKQLKPEAIKKEIKVKIPKRKVFKFK